MFLKVPKALFIPLFQPKFHMLKPLLKGVHGSTLRWLALIPPGYHKIKQGGISQPHQLKLERGILRGLKSSDRELNWAMVRACLIKNF
jgi:hypothetical protein